jgi:hypothetical protein
MRNDKGAYFLLIITDPDGRQNEFNYDNAEAARKHASMNEAMNPNGLRHLFKMLPNVDPIEIMV